jgi:glycosyltransferase involved in cell wall biosynthesis
MKTPQLTIGIPVYNGENFLAETLDCLLGQTFEDFVVIISDNASTDSSAEICEEYSARDSRVRLHRQDQNIGAGPNHNYVVEVAETPLVKIAAHDDLYAPTYLERCIEVLDRDPGVVLAHSDGYLINNDGVPYPFDERIGKYVDPHTNQELPREPVDVAESGCSNERFHEVLHKVLWCTDMYGIMRREALNRTSLFESYYGSDKVFLAEMALLGRFYHVRENLFMKRYHSEMSASMTAEERIAFMDTGAPKKFQYLELFKGYSMAALRTGSLGISERMRCLGSVAQKTVLARYWRAEEF